MREEAWACLQQGERNCRAGDSVVLQIQFCTEESRPVYIAVMSVEWE